MFAAMSLLMLLVPALEGTSATGEPQHSDPSCLLQKKVADQAMTQIDPVEPPLICEDCQCLTDAEPSNPVFPIGGFDECLDHCFGLPGFTYRELASGDAVCWCCNDLDTEDIEIDKLIDKFGLGETTFQAVYSTDLAEEEGDGGGPAGDPEAGCGPEDPVENICPSGTMCGCLSNPGPPGPPLENAAFSDCKDLCVGFPGFVIRELPDFSDASGGTKTQCWCCDSTDLENIPENGYWVNYEVYACPAAADLEGDPHIKTLDGRHYTLLKQGTYSLWHFSGVDAVASQEGQVNKVPVDWQIYSHYSGSQSFTKGLLLVDKSGGSVKHVLELTSQDCEWKARSAKDNWKVVSDGPISAPYAGTELLVSKKSGAKGHNHVRLKLKTQKGKTEVAVLSLSCRPHHSINLQLVMRNRADNRFVDGELKTGRRDFSDFSKLSMMQTSTSQDSEFAVQDSWQSLGGSEQAALYLEDQAQAAPMSLLSTPCTSEKENAAKATCSKHLGDMEKDQTLFQDCVFDLCHGADETVAELAAELRDSTRAI